MTAWLGRARRRNALPRGGLACVTAVTLLVIACDAAPDGDAGAIATDGGAPRDASTRIDAGPATDASATDASSPADAAGNDSGSSIDASAPMDAAPSMDAAHAIDGGSTDGGALGDAGSDASIDEDAGPPIAPIELYPPRAYVERGATQADVTSATPIVFDVSFNEPIQPGTLQASDFAIEPAVPLTATIVDLGDPARFELHLSNLPRVDATYRVELPYGRVTDPSGNPNEPSVSVDNDVVYDDPAVSTVDVRAYPPTTPVMNTLPITFQIVFQALSVVGFDVSDMVNGGSAPGVVWELEPLTEGYVYLARATAVGAQGTVFPVVPAGATVATVGAQPNLESVYVGSPVTYTPLAILVLSDAVGTEGGSLAFNARFEGALRPSTETLFDWATEDGSGVAGVDYTARDVTDQSIAAGAFGTTFYVPARAGDAVPSLDKDFRVRIRNVRGDVFVADDVGVGIVRSDDRGTYYYGGNSGGNPQAGGTDIFVTATDIFTYGYRHDYGLTLRRQDLVTASPERFLTVEGSSPGGLEPHALGYYYAANDSEGIMLRRYTYATDLGDAAFGDYGDLAIQDPTDTLRSMDVTANDSHVFVIGQRTTPEGDSAWLLEARDAFTGAPSASFGAAGRIVLDRVSGAALEAPLAAQNDGTSLYVLGAIDGVYHIEKRSVVDGALVSGFGAGGVVELSSYTSVADLALRDGSIFIVGVEPGGSTLEQFDAVDGTPGWVRGTLMDDPRCVVTTDHGLYIGGSRDGAMHLERWDLDGAPRWVRTAEADRAPAGIGAIAFEEGSFWIHSAGHQTWGIGNRDWYYDRRYIEDGFRHTHAAGEPPE